MSMRTRLFVRHVPRSCDFSSSGAICPSSGVGRYRALGARFTAGRLATVQQFYRALQQARVTRAAGRTRSSSSAGSGQFSILLLVVWYCPRILN